MQCGEKLNIIVLTLYALVSVCAPMTRFNQHIHRPARPDMTVHLFLYEQCISEDGRERLSTLMMRETRFCEDFRSREQCKWGAYGKVYYDCRHRWHDLVEMLSQTIDMDGDTRISIHEKHRWNELTSTNA